MTQPTWIGKTLSGRYHIEELLGQGGMSAVYKATDPNLGRVVAIKLIHPHLSSDPEFVRRFEEEAKAVAQLRHPNIIQVYDFNHDGDVYFIVFEFVPGETLQARLKRLHQANRRLDLEHTIQVGAGVADALVYAHERGLIHRDIKPANVMLNVNNDPILMDFGIVKIMGGTQHTATGAVMGTARYMSPEQIKGQRIDERTDIYSLGVMLFEMAGGRAPFEAESAMTVMMMHVSDPVPDLRQLRPDVPGPLVRIINQALAKDRANRFQRVAEIATALRTTDLLAPPLPPEVTMLDSPPEATVVDSAPTSEPPAYRATTLDSAPAAAIAGATGRAQEPATTPPSAPAGPLTGRRNMLLTAGALLALVLIVGLGILYATGVIGGGNGDDGTPIAGAQATDEAAEGASGNGDDSTPLAETLATDEATGEASGLAGAPATASPTATTAPPTATATAPPTVANTATNVPPTNTVQPTATTAPPPTATVPPEPFARINAITVENERYIVQYETFEYTEVLPGMHVHFFFDTVPPAQAGVPGAGPWFVYGGPRPFTGYTLADRPAAAEQMCILVANSDHSVQSNSGNCVNLPP
jgi:serine/threonine-protein kinase